MDNFKIKETLSVVGLPDLTVRGLLYCQFSIVFKCSWGHCLFPRAFENNGLCKIWGANKVYYGEFENRECTNAT